MALNSFIHKMATSFYIAWKVDGISTVVVH